MLLITRRLAGRLRTVLRKALNLSTHGLAPPVQLDGGPDGLRVRCRTPDAAAEFHLAGEQPAEQIAVPFQMLSDVEGRKDDPVEIRVQEGQVLASWRDGSVPQVVQHDAPETPGEDWPPVPGNLAENAPGLFAALDDACQTTDPLSTRYSLACVQLRAAGGKVVATDGRQLLVQTGFEFPWDGDILVPAAKVFGSPQLPQDEPVRVGKTDDWFTLSVGPWSFWWRIDKDGRFPKVEDHIQRPKVATASFQLSEADRRFLVENLPRLPADDAMNFPVTLDLNGHVAVRAKGEGQTKATELLLSGSATTGDPVRVNTNRQYLARAVRLGFDRVHVFSHKTPVLACDDRRSYVWALLDPESSIAPAEDAIRIPSPGGDTQAQPSPPTPRKRKKTMSKSRNSQNGRSKTDAHTRPPAQAKTTDQPVASLVEQAEAVRASLKETLTKTSELITCLKQHNKQTESVRAALASLRQLEKAGA